MRNAEFGASLDLLSQNLCLSKISSVLCPHCGLRSTLPAERASALGSEGLRGFPVVHLLGDIK